MDEIESIIMAKITKNLKWIVPVLICVGILVLSTLIYMATRTSSGLTSVLLQLFSLVISSGISIFGGHLLSQRRSQRTGKPHARSALRRLITLYNNLSRAGYALQSLPKETVEDYRVLLTQLEEIIVEQLFAADDAIEDWADIIPEEVAQFKRASESDNITEENNG